MNELGAQLGRYLFGGGWWLAVVWVPISVVTLAFFWRGVAWDSRAPAGDAFKFATGIAFAGWIHPAFGILAGLGTYWWIRVGRQRIHGGLLWPLAAMAVFLASQTPLLMLILATILACLVALIHCGFGVLQAFKQPLWEYEKQHGVEMVHGAIGHRTGLAIYLALLCPLVFLFEPLFALPLLALYGVVILLTRSSVGAIAAMAGIVWVHPAVWPWALAFGGLGFLSRMIKFTKGGIWSIDVGFFAMSIRAPDHPWAGRLRIWRETFHRSLTFPHVLIGHGPWSFYEHGRTWMHMIGGKEVYREAHNDYLEFFYDHGLVGVCALLWLVWRLQLALGDPWSGCLIAFGVAALVNFPSRVAIHLAVVTIAVGALWR